MVLSSGRLREQPTESQLGKPVAEAVPATDLITAFRMDNDTV